MSHDHPIRHHAVHSSVIFTAIGLGIALGYFFPQHSHFYHTVSHLYMALLEMSVLPVMSAAVVTGLGNLFHEGSTMFYVKRMAIVFAVGMLAACLVSLTLSCVISPGSRLSHESIATISQMLPTSEEGSEMPPIGGFWDFLKYMIPENIFAAFNKGQMLPVLFASVLFGIGLGIQSDAAAKDTIKVIRSIYAAFTKIIGWVMVGLPAGMCFLFAEYVSLTGLRIFEAMTWWVVATVAAFIIMIVIYAVVISIATRQPLKKSFIQLKAPLFLAFFTSSSLVTMPVTLDTLHTKFDLDKDVVDLSIPLGISLNRQAGMIGFIIMGTFLAQLYGHPLTLLQMPLLVFTALLASMAGAGMPAIASISMAGIVFLPLGLPVAVGIPIMHAMEPLTDPFATVVNVMGNCAATIVIAKKKPDA